MATPYINQESDSDGTRENYNDSHSEIRARIDCAFGMLTERWTILRSPMPKNIGISKIISLVRALAKLQNFCMDRHEESAGAPYARDYAALIGNAEGYVPLVHTRESNLLLPTQLLNGGNHFDDVPREVWDCCIQLEATLPRQRLCETVREQQLVRPSFGSM
jgi:hypothetical protein